MSGVIPECKTMDRFLLLKGKPNLSIILRINEELKNDFENTASLASF